MSRARRLATLAIAGFALASAACEFGREPVAVGRPQPVVHAVLDPTVYPTYDVLLENTLTGRVDVRTTRYDPNDPIVSGGGDPISGATVEIAGNAGMQGAIVTARGIELVTQRTDGKGRGVYRFKNLPPPAMGPGDGNELPIIRTRTYELRVTLPDGRTMTATTTIPVSLPRPDTLATRTFDRERDAYLFTWPAAELAHRYLLRIDTPYGPFQLFTPDTGITVTGDLRNLFAEFAPHAFVPGFLQTLQVSAVDTNYYDYFRSRNNPFTGTGIIDHVTGGTGVFGAVAPIRTSRLEVVAPVDDPIEGRWRASGGGATMDLYLDGASLASGRLIEGTVRRGLLGTRSGGRLTMAVLRGQLANDTLDVFTAELRGAELLVRRSDGSETTFVR